MGCQEWLWDHCEQCTELREIVRALKEFEKAALFLHSLLTPAQRDNKGATTGQEPRLTDQLQKYFKILPAVYCFQMTHYTRLLSLCAFLLSCHETGESGQTWVLHFVVPLLSQASLSAWGWVQAQRKYNKAFMMMCIINWKGGREGSTGNLWVSEWPDTPQHTPEAAQSPNPIVSFHSEGELWAGMSREAHGGAEWDKAQNVYLSLWLELQYPSVTSISKSS